MGIITSRRRRERRRRIMRRLALAAALAAAVCMAAQGGLPSPAEMLDRAEAAMSRGIRGTQQVFAGGAAQAELSLPRREVFALQLGVFDNAQRAAQQAERLREDGVLSMIWQGGSMRIVSDAAIRRDALDRATTGGNDVYVYQETLPAVSMRLRADARALGDVQALLILPDSTLVRLTEVDGMLLEDLVAQVRKSAEAAIAKHPENTLYTQLAESLVNWCDLMEAEGTGEAMRGYARATMGALCRELRRVLLT